MEKKEKYSHAEIELVYFDKTDVIATSTQFGNPGMDYNGWTNSNSKSKNTWS